MMEGGIRIPFFANWPARIQAGVSSAPVWLVDLLATFGELAGAESSVPKNDGTSLVPLLSGDPGSFPADRPLYWENAREQAVRKGPWKAYRATPDDSMELFLIEEDIQCERDLASAYPQVVAEMGRIMRRSHVDHPWYWNPRETREEYQQKESRAREQSQLQVAREPNSDP